jgi:hypothetical protein
MPNSPPIERRNKADAGDSVGRYIDSVSSRTGIDLSLATKDDLEEIGSFLTQLGGPLFHERFPGKTASDFYRWKYFENPAGDALIAAAKSGAHIVSVAAATPKRISCDGQTYLAFELGDFLTAQSHRKQGLFSNAIALLCSEAAGRNAALVYVRPNEQSFPILQKHLQFEEPHQFDTRRYITPSAFLKRRTGLPARAWQALGVDRIMHALALGRVTPGIRVERADNFDCADELWQATNDKYRLALIRDRTYLHWRYINSPTPYHVFWAYTSGRPVGYAVTFGSTADSVGFITDLYTAAADTTTAQALVSTCIRDLADSQVTDIYTWTLAHAAASAPHRALVHACPFSDRNRLHIAFRFVSPVWNSARLPERSWHLTLGDFDGI